jgi:Septum formation
VPTGVDYQPPTAYQAAVQQAPRNGLGTTALILGIIGALTGVIPFMFWLAGALGLIGLILGFIARGRVKRGEATNGTAALWGIITSAVAVVLSIVGLVILVGVVLSEEGSMETESTASPAVETSAPTQAQETAPPGAEEAPVLEVGDCLTEIQAIEEEILSVETVPCSQPHSAEMYAVVPLPEGDGNYPGTEAIFAQAEEICIAEFEGFVGLSYEESVLEFNYLYPHEGSWDAGEHSVICAVYDPDGDTTGTLANANR